MGLGRDGGTIMGGGGGGRGNGGATGRLRITGILGPPIEENKTHLKE